MCGVDGNNVVPVDNSSSGLYNWMINPQRWTKFLNSYSEQVTGGPTKAQLENSAKGLLGINNLEYAVRLNNPLYATENFWYVAGPVSSTVIQDVEKDGWFGTTELGADWYCSVRPLVKLKENVNMTWNGTAWNLSN